MKPLLQLFSNRLAIKIPEKYEAIPTEKIEYQEMNCHPAAHLSITVSTSQLKIWLGNHVSGLLKFVNIGDQARTKAEICVMPKRLALMTKHMKLMFFFNACILFETVNRKS